MSPSSPTGKSKCGVWLIRELRPRLLASKANGEIARIALDEDARRGSKIDGGCVAPLEAVSGRRLAGAGEAFSIQ